MKVFSYLMLIVVCLILVLSETVCTSYSSGGSGSETPNVLNSRKRLSQITENDSIDLPSAGSLDTLEGIKQLKQESSFKNK